MSDSIDEQLADREPWQWDEPVWRAEVDRVRAGRALVDPDPASRWPGGAKCAVMITYDADHETPFLRDNQTTPGSLSVGEYGSRVAVPRVLKMLERNGVKATFYTPGVSALLHPQDIEAFVAGGHEVGVHGWIHERNTELPYEAELDLIGRATENLEKLSGTRPVGIRTPSWDFSHSTLQVIRDMGFVYDASLMADEEPYEILADGTPTGIVEIPCEWIRDDAPYFSMNRFGGIRPHTPPRDVEQIWKDEFDMAYAEGGVFELTLHPHISGHRSRISAVERVIQHALGKEDVWVGTHAELADFLRGKFEMG
ncbi:polysaccharide deacetylase [Brevibacterium sp. 50QC2O2]|uniref:polysaccharide deacetylase family protein n=1 Tax=Brevibacterium sp. 50QC2O2 TaxID=2968459 RepID=UPI00211C2F13|nr:polysaccharide deacetylase [Brevibacterium sp. 50QC2O2]MCQ9388476.1 polysaccharide deacetylase [Brevibacterium sp. 50QC2O2]